MDLHTLEQWISNAENMTKVEGFIGKYATILGQEL